MHADHNLATALRAVEVEGDFLDGSAELRASGALIPAQPVVAALNRHMTVLRGLQRVCQMMQADSLAAECGEAPRLGGGERGDLLRMSVVAADLVMQDAERFIAWGLEYHAPARKV